MMSFCFVLSKFPRSMVLFQLVEVKMSEVTLWGVMNEERDYEAPS